MARMTEEQKAVRAAEREAKAQAEQAAYIKRIVDAAPEPSLETIVKIRTLLGMDRTANAKRGPSEYEQKKQRELREREAALASARKLALSLTACDVCNIQPEQHFYAQKGAIDFHEWVPGRAEKVMRNYK